jgi:hypothetical protein
MGDLDSKNVNITTCICVCYVYVVWDLDSFNPPLHIKKPYLKNNFQKSKL